MLTLNLSYPCLVERGSRAACKQRCALLQAAEAARTEAHAAGLEPMQAPWRPSTVRADASLGAAAVALVDDRYGHSIEVAAARLQVAAPLWFRVGLP